MKTKASKKNTRKATTGKVAKAPVKKVAAKKTTSARKSVKKSARKSVKKSTASSRRAITASSAAKTRKKQTPPSKQTRIHAFPGYPPYPASEDITRNSKKIDADIEDLSLSKTARTTVKQPTTKKLRTKSADELVDESLKASKNELTKEDFEALGPKDLSLDMGDDEGLKHRASPVDFAGKDMDVPGSELDDDPEANCSEDEENNSYSLGGDNHEDLEEDRS